MLKRHYECAGNAFLPAKALVPIALDSNKATPLVTYGQYVEEGEVIARGDGRTMTDVHAPIPGIIGDIRSFDTGYGCRCTCIPIRLAGTFNMLGRRTAQYTWQSTSPVELLHLIAEKALIYTAKPFEPLAFRLRKFMKVQNGAAVIVRLALFDWDPSCAVEGALLKNFFTEVLEGCGIIARILEDQKIEIFHNAHLPAAARENIQSRLNCSEVLFCAVPNRYPLYDYKRKKTDLNDTNYFEVLPSTAVAVYDAVVHDRPLISSYILFSGDALKEPQLLKARLGTPIGSLIEECGGLVTQPAALVINGFFTGYSCHNFDLPIDKTIKSISVVRENRLPKFHVLSCAHCGQCKNTCPQNLDPARMVRAIQKGMIDDDDRLQIAACIECGVCSACCPARIPLCNIIGQYKRTTGDFR